MKFSIILRLLLLLSLRTSLMSVHGDDSSSSNTTSSDSNSSDSSGSTTANGSVALGFGLTALAAVACAIGSSAPFLDKLLARTTTFKDFKITESKGFLASAFSLSAGILIALATEDLFPSAVQGFSGTGWFDPKWSKLVATAFFITTAVTIMTTKHYVARLISKKTHKVVCVCDPTALECKCLITEPGKGPILGTCACEIKDVENISSEREHERTKRLAMQTTIALFIHNIPEGLSSFAITIGSKSSGIIYAIALSMHKFPEGLIMSVPIYHATGSRLLAFAIAATAGVIAQMFGAVLGYIFYSKAVSGVQNVSDVQNVIGIQALSGILFSVVVGGLLFVAFHNMLPIARRYDPEDRYVTYFTFGGLFFFSIVDSIFDISGESS